MVHVPPLHSPSETHERLGSFAQNEPTLAKKSQLMSVCPSQPDSSPRMTAPVCNWKLSATPVQPASRSAPGLVLNVTSPRPGQVHTLLHFPGQRLSSVPSQSSPVSRWLSPQTAAQWQSDWHDPAQLPVPVPSQSSPGSIWLLPQYGPQ